MDGFAVVLLMAVPVIGLIVLVVVMNRWGKKHDPMKRTNFQWLTPRSPDRRSDSHQD
jgi:hypothetical protein